MEKSTPTNRRRKNGVIIVLDDDESSTQPLAKNAKRDGVIRVIEAEPVPPSEVVELRRRLKAVKKNSFDVGQTMLRNTGQQLVYTHRKLMNTELALEVMRKRACRTERDAARLRAELAENLRSKRVGEVKITLLEERVIDLTNRLNEEIHERRRADQRIAQLNCRLVEYGRNVQVVEEVVVDMTTVESAVVVHLRPPQPNDNILALVCPSYEKSISIDGAVKQLRKFLNKCGEEVQRCAESVAKYDCHVCGVLLGDNLSLLNHFLSKGHMKKVRAHGAAVSHPAIKNWQNTLDHYAEYATRGAIYEEQIVGGVTVARGGRTLVRYY
ncbi:hypothetical protein PMAYCL1PPCAC_14543 [Pristionchus mayeri]|uniref:C2H2-type domain-containing protein n=1 Tax=Pristionchus mayeri TaxID=1317129 RepID=A0AAN4ZN76_9BILA|nr:hypothetical protein PMAYCL1PPCAC_14543 [Pristionchus mayeri]